uniref:Iron regulator 1 n=1 Tax=Ganoderma boninense TaxID=34458 RepID=A0A5K1K837_9APHY|nr:Iron regulator 1 [Ganoderma boninense]
MQPVPCWEKVWCPPDGAAPGTTLRVYKWVKTDKKQVRISSHPPPLRIAHIPTLPFPSQQFSDDEGEADQPLAPIQPEDLVEVVEGDDDMEQDEAANSNATPGPMSREVSEAAPVRPPNESVGEISVPPSKAPSPKPHPLSISFQPPTPTPGPEDVDDGLQDALMPPQAGGEDDGDLGGGPLDGGDLSMGGDEGMSLDLGGMGPDGEQFEGADLSQLQSADPLLGGPLMDTGMDDPFSVPPA